MVQRPGEIRLFQRARRSAARRRSAVRNKPRRKTRIRGFWDELLELLADIAKFIIRDIIEQWLFEKLLAPLFKALFSAAGAATVGIGAVGVGAYQYLDSNIPASLDAPQALLRTAPVLPKTTFSPDPGFYRDQAVRDADNARLIDTYREQTRQNELLRLRNQPYENFRRDQEQHWRENARRSVLLNSVTNSPSIQPPSVTPPIPRVDIPDYAQRNYPIQPSSPPIHPSMPSPGFAAPRIQYPGAGGAPR